MSEKVAAISTLLVAGAGNLQTAAILIAISAIAIAVYKCKEKKRLILMKLTSRIIDILSKNAEIIMTYNEINLILKVVKAAVEGAQGEGNDKN